MLPKRILITINVSLGLIALFLLLNLWGIELPSLGQAQYWWDQEEPLCAVNWQEEFNAWGDLDRCCLEARKQLGCRRERKELSWGRMDWVCQTGREEVLQYWLNNKAHNYCRQLSLW